MLQGVATWRELRDWILEDYQTHVSRVDVARVVEEFLLLEAVVDEQANSREECSRTNSCSAIDFRSTMAISMTSISAPPGCT